MTDVASRVLGLSYDLEGTWLGATAAPAIAGALTALIPADSIGAFDGDGATRSIAMWSDTPGLASDQVLEPLLDTFFEHPMYLSFIAAPTDLSPRRLSDLLPLQAWLAHRVYHELFVPMGVTYQVAVRLRPQQGDAWAGWVMNRADADFDDRELEILRAMQPLLAAFETLASSSRRPADEIESPLTARETAVLRLLAEALTATQIGFVLRISPRTVRKHIEHIYEKLDCHDRVRAIRNAQRLGLLAEAGAPESRGLTRFG